MASCAVLGMVSSLKLGRAIFGMTSSLKLARLREDVYSRSNVGGLMGTSQRVRSLMYYHGERRFLIYNSQERRRAASAYAPYEHLRDGSTLQNAVTKLMDSVSQGKPVNCYAYKRILKWCSQEKDLESVKKLHGSIKDSQTEQHPYVANMLLKCYIECGRLKSAHDMFIKLTRKDTVTWNLMIAGCAKHDQMDGAIEMYRTMRKEGGQPDAITFLSVLKACAKPTALEWGKEIHSHIIRDDLQGDVRIASALVRMYSNCGSIEDARAVFSALRKRDVWSWNLIIRGLAEHGFGVEAFSLFLQMQREGFTPSVITYLSILNPSSSTGATEWLKEVHAQAMKIGLDVDMQVGTALVQMYFKSGNIEEARAVFDRLGRRDVRSWNVIIGGLAEHGLGREAFSLFIQMQTEGFTPDAITYVSLLNPSLSTGATEWVKEVHACALKAGLDVDMLVGTALVKMYAKRGNIEEARAVFGRLGRRDVKSWSVMIGGLAERGLGHEAYSLFIQMQREGFSPDVITYLNILNPSSSASSVDWLKKVHAHAMEAGLDVDMQVGNAFVQMFAKSGSIEDARAVFGRMDRRDVRSWNMIIGGLAENGFLPEAFSLFIQMQREGFTPDSSTYVSILKPSSSKGTVEWVKEVHAYATEAGLDVGLQVGTALVQMYTKTGSIKDAKAVFDGMGSRDVRSWNIIIGGLAEHGLGQEALSLFLQMQIEGFTPDAITYLSILKSSSSTGATELVKEVHAYALDAGFDVDVQVGTALLQLYAKSGSIDDARAVFGRLGRRDVRSWSVMIGGLAEHGLGHEAFSLFLEMQREGFTPDAITYLSILNPRSGASAAEWVKEVHAHAIKAGLDVDVRVGNALVQMCAKTGLIADAKQVFDKMQNRNVISWAAMLGGLAQHGYGREALQLFEEMKLKGVKPDGVSFVTVLSACSHAGLVEEGSLLFASMRQDYGIEPALEHYNCMVDMLGRAGLLEEAKLFILNMPIEPDNVTWTALLGACRTHKHLELAELAMKECVKLKPRDAVPYVLLSNVYAAVGEWEKVTKIRSFMEERGLCKHPERC